MTKESESSCYVLFCIILQWVGIIFCLFLIAANLLVLIQTVPGITDVFSAMSAILRMFTIMLALMAILAERENAFLYRYFAGLEEWKVLGLLNIFLAILTLANTPVDLDSWVQLVVQISGWCLCGIGVLYFFLGLFGGKRIYKRATKQPVVPA